MNGYYAEGDQQVGPMTTNELLSLAQSGHIKDETLVWIQGMPDWKPFGSVKNSRFFGDSGEDVQPPSVFSNYRQAEAGSAQPLRVAGPVVVGTLAYAGFWIRLVAHIFDVILLIILSVAFEIAFMLMTGGAAEIVRFMLQLAGGAAYVTLFLGKYGATPGKMALSLKVVRPDGGPISYSRAFCRYLAEYLSAIILLIGYIIAAFDSEKRTLHDLICDTRVIHEEGAAGKS